MRGNHKRKNWFYLVLSLIITTAVSVGYNPKDIAAQSVGKPLKIGVAAPLSGPAVPWGNATLRPMLLYADEVNAKGGVMAAGEKHRIEVIYYDHKYRADEAATAVRRLIMRDKCDYLAVLGGGVMPAVAGMIQDNPVICFAVAFGLGVLDPKFDHVFVALSQPVELAYVWKWFAENRPGIKRVAMVAVNDNVGRMSGTMVERRTEEFGLTCVGVEYYERDITDFTAALSRLLAKKPDIIDFDGSPAGTTALILKQARELGFKGDVIHGGHTDPEVIIKMVGPEKAEGFYTSDALPAGFEWYKRKYVERFGEWDNMGPAFGRYGPIVVQAIKKADSLDPRKVLKVLESPDFTWDELFGGKGRFYGKDEPLYRISHQGLVPEYLGQVRNGKFEYVTKYGSPLLPK